MKRVALLCSDLHRFDAVSLDLRGFQKFFAEAGYETRVFAERSAVGLPVADLSGLSAYVRNKQDLLVYAYAGHWPRGNQLFANSKAFNIFRYHNVTPPEFFEPYDAGLAAHSRQGRADLNHLMKLPGLDLCLADSNFNAQDLLEAGAPPERVQVLPVFHQIQDLLDAAPARRAEREMLPSAGSFLQSLLHSDEKLVLMVGRLVPNKGYLNLLRSFALLCQRTQHSCFLMLAGGIFANFAGYYRELEQIIQHQALFGRVMQAGSLTALDLAYLYQRADLFAIMSEHEGFCVPVVEAMALGTPVVALASTAVQETVADAGLLIDENQPAFMAAAMQRVLEDRELCAELIRRGRAHYESQFANQAVAVRLQALLGNQLSQCA